MSSSASSNVATYVARNFCDIFMSGKSCLLDLYAKHTSRLLLNSTFVLFAGLKIHSISSSFCFDSCTRYNINSSILALPCETELIMALVCVLCPGFKPSVYDGRSLANGRMTWKWLACWFGDEDFPVPEDARWFVVCPHCQKDNWRSGEHELDGHSDISSPQRVHNPFALSLAAWRSNNHTALLNLHGRALVEDDVLRLRVWVSNATVRKHHMPVDPESLE